MAEYEVYTIHQGFAASMLTQTHILEVSVIKKSNNRLEWYEHSNPVWTGQTYGKYKNSLKINATKTKTMLIHFTKKPLNNSLSLKIGNRSVEQVVCYKFPGVTVNNDILTWSDHVDMV